MKKLDYAFVGVIGVFLIVVCVLVHKNIIFEKNWFSSNLLFYLFISAYILWIIVEIFNFLYAGVNNRNCPEEDPSFWLILITEISLVLMIIFTNFISYDFKEDNFHLILGTIQTIGIAFMFFGILFREIAIIQLGKKFSTGIFLNQKKKLFQKRLYKYIRNPSYTGSLITLTGIPLSMGAWLGAIFVFVAVLICYSLRVKYEEKELEKVFGKEYLNYKKRTWKFFPGY